MTRGPWVHPGQPNGPEPDRCCAEDIVDRVISHKPCLGRLTAYLGQGPRNNARIGLLDLHRLRNDDRRQKRANAQLRNFGVLALHPSVRDNLQPYPLRMERQTV
jgi:hypothetical protein